MTPTSLIGLDGVQISVEGSDEYGFSPPLSVT